MIPLTFSLLYQCIINQRVQENCVHLIRIISTYQQLLCTYSATNVSGRGDWKRLHCPVKIKYYLHFYAVYYVMILQGEIRYGLIVVSVVSI